ncbi:hypothetical protein M8818_005994 [Zalaria obscura]|uniref:Uncharacterized protein n=1 Tax=Zalaria obscura TaxID=2024903 RepID=A0ACC3S7N3_9PEZI
MKPTLQRPQSSAPFLNVSIQDSSPTGFTPGYIFIAPYQAAKSGPYIYDKFGNLIWDGYGVVGSENAHDFRPCTYEGAPHLCMSQMNQQFGYGIGQAMIINSDYKPVATVNTGGNVPPADEHEFQLLNNGETAILSAYEVIPADLSYFNITTGQGWLSQGVFQEVNVTSGEVVFEWFSTNHVDPSATQILPNKTDVGGTGFTPASPFDYFHINSIDKAPSGNYLVSGRHVCTLYYINATDRSISWRLSFLGDSDFTLQGFNFSFQHDVRIVSENATSTILSIFDNASNGFTSTSAYSAGKVIALDHTANTATLLSETVFPGPEPLLSTSQGNTQLLSNGGVFHGWGDQAFVTEHAANGTAVLQAQFADGSAMNYRAFTSPWVSIPCCTVPDVYAYAHNSSAATSVYVSWNGATEVASWRVYGAQSVGEGTFSVLAEVPKQGFETFYQADVFYAWTLVEALAGDGTALRNSSFQPTFVPGATLAGVCGDAGCPVASAYSS